MCPLAIAVGVAVSMCCSKWVTDSGTEIERSLIGDPEITRFNKLRTINFAMCMYMGGCGVLVRDTLPGKSVYLWYYCIYVLPK